MASAQSVFETFRPNKASLGYALFLAINATAVWGGVFPFLPLSIQEPEIMFWFFTVEASVFALAYLASVVGSYYFPERTKFFLVPLAAVPYALAWACLIAASYVHEATFELVIAGGALLGVGSAGFYMLWQRLFAAREAERGSHDLIAGTAYASIIYLALHAIPQAVTAFLVPLVFLPLFGLAIVLASRKVDVDQPMFTDVPHDHPAVYRRALGDTWRSALSLGGLGFCTGVMRAVAIPDPGIGAMVNVISMAASFIAATALLVLWSRRNIRLNVLNMYRNVFPIILLAFMAMPLIPLGSMGWLAALLYAMHSIGVLFMMIQCAQISRDRGINPVFVYGFFGGIMYALHDFGFISGSIANALLALDQTSYAMIALSAVCVLGILFALGQKRDGDHAAEISDGNSIELVGLTRANMGAGAGTDAGTSAKGALKEADPEEVSKKAPSGLSAHKAAASSPLNPAAAPSEEPPPPAQSVVYVDRIPEQVRLVQADYGLSTREAEVTELLARGETVARIAEALFISENTVRMHSKRIYAKLDVHKKQQLRDLVESY